LVSLAAELLTQPIDLINANQIFNGHCNNNPFAAKLCGKCIIKLTHMDSVEAMAKCRAEFIMARRETIKRGTHKRWAGKKG